MASSATSSTDQTLTTPLERQQQLCTLLRRWILESTSRAGSGHATSSLSAVELMTSLFFGGTLRYDAADPDAPSNDRVIFSKGHASPLLYGLWAAAGQVEEASLTHYREFGSPLEGHPTERFRFAEAATGSLGQGLSIGLGMALAARNPAQPEAQAAHRVFVLLGDSEMSEGSQWEAIQIAAHYSLGNLVGVLDVNRLGQRGPTMYGRHLDAYQRRLEAFGWNTIVVEDGHDLEQLAKAYRQATQQSERPTMLIAATVKGKGVSFLADEEGWHGKALDSERLEAALQELGDVDLSVRGTIARPEETSVETAASPPPHRETLFPPMEAYRLGEAVATRDAYGTALCRLGKAIPAVVALDGEVSNSTRARAFQEAFPERYYEMFVAEQNMVGAATGMALRGKIPFVSTFAAFFTRAFDQIRMAPHSGAGIKFVGSHAGVAIGEDGPSQMGLEDLAMFRSLPESVVVYPSDAVSTERLLEVLVEQPGTAYLRTTRGKTPVLYDPDATFKLGHSHVLRRSDQDQLTIVAAGVTLHEALEAHETLRESGIPTRVIDLYSIKPIDRLTLRSAAMETGYLLTVEDHYAAGGLGEAVLRALAENPVPVFSLCVENKPRSGPPETLLDNQGISAAAIVAKAKEIAQLR